MKKKISILLLFSLATAVLTTVSAAPTKDPALAKIRGTLQQHVKSGTVKSDQIKKVVIEFSDAGQAAAFASGNPLVQVRYRQLVQVGMKIEDLLNLTKSKTVNAVRYPFLASPKQVTSESINIVGANLMQDKGVDGSGVHVLVLDVGFLNYTALRGVELPAEMAVKNLNDDGFETTPHGAAVAEIVHDMAPGAEITLVAIGTDVEYMAAMDWILQMDNPPDIVTASIGFNNVGPLDGTSVITAAANRLADEGNIMHFNSAGNEQKDYYSAVFNDPDGNGWHNFAVDDEQFELGFNADEPFLIIANWDDWGSNPANPASSQDYDFYLWCPGTTTFDEDTACNVAGEEQSGLAGQAPLEYLDSPSLVGGVYRVGIKRAGGNMDKLMRVYFVNEAGQFGLEYITTESTLSLPADGQSVIAVGAHFVQDPILDVDTEIRSDDPQFLASDWLRDTPPEGFSSFGPTWDGRTKPDLSAADGVSTVSFGENGFFGTSAAAPHAAGAAALIMSENPYRDGAEVLRLMAGTAEDVLPRGMDNQHGAGRVNLLAVSQRSGMSSRTALYHNAGQSGHGFSVDIRGNRILVFWYIYDALGRARWLITSGVLIDGHFDGTLYSVDGPLMIPPVAGLFDAAGSTVTAVIAGSLSLDFLGGNQASFDVTLNGVSDLATGDFSVLTEVLLTRAPATSDGAPYLSSQSGNMHSPEQNGHGVFLFRQGDTHSPHFILYPSDQVGAIWYRYSNTDGNSQWWLSAAPTNDHEVWALAGDNVRPDTLFEFGMDNEGFDGSESLEEFFGGNDNPVVGRPIGIYHLQELYEPPSIFAYNHRFLPEDVIEFVPLDF